MGGGAEWIRSPMRNGGGLPNCWPRARRRGSVDEGAVGPFAEAYRRELRECGADHQANHRRSRLGPRETTPGLAGRDKNALSCRIRLTALWSRAVALIAGIDPAAANDRAIR